MASANREGLKRTLLLGFVAVNVILIGLIWTDGLVAHQPATPSYYRDTFQMDPDVYLTVTAEAVEFENQRNGTPAAHSEEEQHGSDSGQGHGQDHKDATAVATPTMKAGQTP